MTAPTVTAGALKWAAASYGLRQIGVLVVSLSANLLLTRILSPQDFGLVAIATMVFGLGALVADGGLGLYLIQRPEDVTDRDLSEILNLQFLLAALPLGILLMVIVVMRLMGMTHVALPLSLVACCALPFSAVRGIALLPSERMVQMGKIALVDVVEQLTWGVGAVALAFAGWGPWSLVTAMLFKAIVGCLLAVRLAPWRYAWGLPAFTPEFRTGLKFALHYQGSLLINIVRSAINPFFIGSLLGLKSVGFVDRAWFINSAPVSLLSSIHGKVFFPFTARIQEDRARLRRFLEDSIFVSGVLDKLFYLPLFLFAEPAVALLFTDAWLPMVPTLRWLVAGTMLFGALASPMFPVFNGLGASRFLFRYGLMTALASWAVTVPLVWRFGMEGVGMGTVLLWLGAIWLYREMRTHIGDFGYLRNIWQPIGAALIAGAVTGMLELRFGAPESLSGLVAWSLGAVTLYVLALGLLAGSRLVAVGGKIVRSKR